MKKDPRVNTSSANFRTYLMLYLSIALMCSINTSIIILQETNPDMTLPYQIVSSLTYINLITIAILLIFNYFHQRHYAKPMFLIGSAAKKVALGDFSVRIPAQRTDGKKDEFEIIYEDLNAMVEELASVEMLKRDFVSNVSHELKSPLSVIQTYATTLQSEALTDEERKEYTGKIINASRRLSVLVSNILQMSRLENQKIQPKQKPFNLSEQISRCALDFEPVWTEKDISVSFALDQDIILNTDEEMLDIVWNNLISNALKFTGAGGNVAVSAKMEGDHVCVTVADTGCGISAKAISHIFDKFYQEDTSHATEGNGLGLALTKQICTLFGCTITVDSTEGVGTKIAVFMDQHMQYTE